MVFYKITLVLIVILKVMVLSMVRSWLDVGEVWRCGIGYLVKLLLGEGEMGLWGWEVGDRVCRDRHLLGWVVVVRVGGGVRGRNGFYWGKDFLVFF
jgi:hypothetical protein